MKPRHPADVTPSRPTNTPAGDAGHEEAQATGLGFSTERYRVNVNQLMLTKSAEPPENVR